MSTSQKIWAIVAAAGLGKRMNSQCPKQYLPLLQKRVLDYALLSLCESDLVDGIIVGIHADDRWWQAHPFTHDKLLAVSTGGAQRAHTVLNALQLLLHGGIAKLEDWVIVHDAARPCLCHSDIARLVTAARAHGHGAVLALRLADTLKQTNHEGMIEKTIRPAANGNTFWRALTPQMFRCGQLHSALQQSLADFDAPPDESTAMERLGVTAIAVECHPSNIKITWPADLEWAECILRSMESQHEPKGKGADT